MSYAGAIAAVLSSAIGAFGPGESSTSTADVNGAIELENKFRPIDYSAGLQQLLGQSGFGAGADPTQLGIELLTRQIESSANPAKARDFQKRAQAVQSLLMQQQLSPGDPKIQKQLDKMLSEMNTILGKRGLGAVGVDANGFNITLADKGLQQILDTAKTQGAGIRQNRLTAEENLSKLAADFPTATAAELDALTKSVRESQMRELDQSYRTDSDRIMAEANLRGYNPAGILSELDKNRADAAFDTQFTAADRALQILTGRQQGATGSITGINLALSPDRLIALTNAMKGQQTPTTGQLASAQLTATQQQPTNNNIGNSLTSVFSQLSDQLLLRSILGENRNKSGPAAGNRDIDSPASVGITEGLTR